MPEPQNRVVDGEKNMSLNDRAEFSGATNWKVIIRRNREAPEAYILIFDEFRIDWDRMI